MPQYQPYTPTPWQKRVDNALGLVSPKWGLNRMVSREKAHWFRYMAAQSTSARPNSTPSSGGEWMRIQREKMQVMWNAIDMVDNSGLCSGILLKFPTYVCGTLRWQAKTGDRNINLQYQQYIQHKTCIPSNIDVTRRFSLRQMAMLDVKSIMLKGDVGTNIVRDDNDEVLLQGIEANRIGDPYKWVTSGSYVRGLELDEAGAIAAARIYHQDRLSGTYRYDGTVPTRDANGLPRFLFFTNPISFDDYRGVSAFKHAIDNDTYITTMRQYELQALLWAASQSGVYYTKSGTLPEGLPYNRNQVTDRDGNTINTYDVRPNTVIGLDVAEDVKMFNHDRPSPNVIGMYENTVLDICNGIGCTKAFGYNMEGLTGPAVRMCSAQDARAISIWQEMMREQKLDPTIMLLLGDGIAKGHIPYHPNWLQWDWFFPAKPTIDVGRESNANIEEIAAGVNTRANVTAEANLGDIEEITAQLGHEVQGQIEQAREVAKNIGEGVTWLQVYPLMFPPQKGGGMGGMGGAPPSGNGNGATDDGVSLDGEKQQLKKNGAIPVQFFYREDQERDDHGRFADEGRGSEESGYVHPGGMTNNPDEYAKAQLEDVKNGKRGLSKEPHNGQPTFVYRDENGRPIGIARYDKNGLSDLAVAKEHRRKGVGTKLIEAVKGEGITVAKGPMSKAGEAVTAKAGMTHEAEEAPTNEATAVVPDKRRYDQRMTALDRRLVDYKPDRSLSDPDKVERLDHILPNTSYTPYSQTPFFNGVNHIQGTSNAEGTDVGTYVASRDRLFEKQPIMDVPLDNVVVTQHLVNKDRVAQLVEHPETGGTKPISAVRYGDQTYILNGHHRVAADIQRGETSIKAHVLEYVDPPKDDADIPRYVEGLSKTARYKEATETMAQYGATQEERESYTQRANQKDGKYTPERQELHNEIVAKMLNPKADVPADKTPQITFLIGASGAGKSTVGLPYAKAHGEATYLNPDDIRENLPEYNGSNAPATQRESKDIHKQVGGEALARHQNIIEDVTGSNTARLDDQATAWGKAGYDVNVVFVDLPLHMSAERVWNRYQNQGRFVDMDYLLNDVDHNPIKTYAKLKSNSAVKNWISIDNKGNRPAITDQGHREDE